MSLGPPTGAGEDEAGFADFLSRLPRLASLASSSVTCCGEDGNTPCSGTVVCACQQLCWLAPLEMIHRR